MVDTRCSQLTIHNVYTPSQQYRIHAFILTIMITSNPKLLIPPLSRVEIRKTCRIHYIFFLMHLVKYLYVIMNEALSITRVHYNAL